MGELYLKRKIDLFLSEWKKKAKELSMMLFAKKKMRYVTLSDFELRLAKAALILFRNALIAKGLPTEDVNALLLKLYK